MSYHRKPRHRKGNVKREHHLLQGIENCLEEVGKHPDIKSVIPGRIKSAIRGSQVDLQFKYRTTSGLKFLAKSSGGVQEIFIVTSKPEEIIEFIESMFRK